MRAISPDTLPVAVLEASYVLGKLAAASRKAAKISQVELCSRVGISRQTLNQIEQGSPRVQLAHWLVVLDHFGLMDSLVRSLSASQAGQIAEAMPRSRR